MINVLTYITYELRSFKRKVIINSNNEFPNQYIVSTKLRSIIVFHRLFIQIAWGIYTVYEFTFYSLKMLGPVEPITLIVTE